jgi:hypothetical protein
MTIYGTALNDLVQVFAIDEQSMPQANGQSFARFGTLAESHGLDLVWWCRCARVSHLDPLFRELLTGKAD